MRTVYVNGDFVAESEAMVSVFDRGFLMSDSVYEVMAVIRGRLLDFDAHISRLGRSLDALAIPHPLAPSEMKRVILRVLEENRLEEGIIYLQITRGVADRDFVFPEQPQPGIVMFTQAKALLSTPQATNGIRVVTRPDLRWGRCDIKTTQLLPACMAKADARLAGADDAWMVRDGRITEGTSSNAFIITKERALITRQLSNEILHGITRAALVRLAAEAGLTIEQRAFSPEEVAAAEEAFITSASTFVWPVVAIDGRTIGDGMPGLLTRSLRHIYLDEALGTSVLSAG